MPAEKEHGTMPTPGFSGFIPTMRYQFGLTYGNASRKLAQEGLAFSSNKQNPNSEELYCENEQQDANNDLWKTVRGLATVDDRFSFPPVPGYTGYIPRCHENFARPFAEATKDSLRDFQKVLKAHQTEPVSIQRLKAGHYNKQAKSIHSKQKRTATSLDIMEAKSPFKLPKGHTAQTFVAGYTGFIPRHQKFFGERYGMSVRHAIEDFLEPVSDGPQETEGHISNPDPIPGFTGFVPGSKYSFSKTYGKTTHEAYDAFTRRDLKTGKIPDIEPSEIRNLDRRINRPIAGYKGHLPSVNKAPGSK